MKLLFEKIFFKGGNHGTENKRYLPNMSGGKNQLEDGSYPKNTINCLVDNKLKELAEGLYKFGKEEEDS